MTNCINMVSSLPFGESYFAETLKNTDNSGLNKSE